MSKALHWDAAYGRDGPLSWSEAEAAQSLSMIARAGLEPGQAVVDVGGGASPLAGDLLARGLGPVTVLDLSQVALDTARARLGDTAAQVSWICGDVTEWQPAPESFALWHDRAAFHFLTDAAGQAAYAAVLHRALRPGGAAVIASFAPDGPERCSGLPVKRWSPEALAKALDLHLTASDRFVHVTPGGVAQRFQISLLRKA